jgi:two-component system sensor histidine kinase ComP
MDLAIWSYDNTNEIFDFITEEFTNITGVPAESFIDWDSWEAIIHPDDLPLFNSMTTKVHLGLPDNSEYRIVHANGQIRVIQVRVIPTKIRSRDITRMNGVVVDITCQKTLEEALTHNNAMYRLIAENTRDFLGIIDVKGTIQFTSDSYQSLLGYDVRFMTGTSSFDYIHQEDRKDVFRILSQAVHERMSKQIRFRLIHSEGHTIPIEYLGTPVLGVDGEVECIVVIGRDITEQVRIEEKLKDSEERYRRLIELLPLPIATHQNGKMMYMNPAGLKLVGARDSSEIIGIPIIDFIHPDDVQIAKAKDRAAFVKVTKYISSVEFKLIRLDGQIIEAEVTELFDEETQTTLSVLNDVTGRRRIERALQESNERYRRMVELSPMTIVVYKDNTLIYVNPAGLRLIRANDPYDVVGKSPLAFVHPKDSDLARERMKHMLQMGNSSFGEYRLIRLDGAVVDVSITSIHDPQSLTVQLVLVDITARKQAEMALLESEEMNRRLVELSPEAIILHSDYEFIYVNPAAVALFGATRDIIGQSILDRIHPDDREKAASRIDKVYMQMYTSPFTEQKVIRYDGSVGDAEVITTPISYMGTNAGLTIVRDNTKRKKTEEQRKIAEDKLLESEDRYSRLQTSLDRFSGDLFGVMKVQELEYRLIHEVKNMINSSKVSLIEVAQDGQINVRCGNHLPEAVPSNLSEWNERLLLCTMVDTADGHLLKLGEHRDRNYLLCINEKPLALTLKPNRIWLETICRYVSVLYDNFRVIEDLTNELKRITSHQAAPSWLLRLLFQLSEHERKRLSQDLHDAALQEQIIWYRKLDHLLSDKLLPVQLHEPLDQIKQGLLDVIYQIRITCNELRPPLLKEEGLVSSLEALFEFTQLRANYSIQFEYADFHYSLLDDEIVGLYRIVQELLANATKHSNATKVNISLTNRPGWLQLIYEDNGIGMDINNVEDNFVSMGVYGMKERVRSMNGTIEFKSSPNKGLAIYMNIPIPSEINH